MRWISGDSAVHKDRAWDGTASFDHSYLVYATDDPEGRFTVGEVSYEIRAGDGFRFSEGLPHGTIGATVDRLLIGPFNESLIPVGFLGLYYRNDTGTEYYNEGALTGTLLSVIQINDLGFGTPNEFTIPSGQIQIGWQYNAGGSYGPTQELGGAPAVDGQIYPVGTVYGLDGGSGMTLIAVYGDAVCFREGTKILTYDPITQKEVYRPIESLRRGDQVRAYKHPEYKTIAMIGSNVLIGSDEAGAEERSKNCLYHLSPKLYPDLTEDLYITGSHAVLVDRLSPTERAAIIERFDRIFVTEGRYRLMACVDPRAVPVPFSPEPVRVYHFALEDENPYRNFGVYANGGLLVETTSQWAFQKKNYLTDRDTD